MRSESTKKLMSSLKTGSLNPKFKGYYVTPAGVFDSAEKAAKATGVNKRTILKRCTCPAWTDFGYCISQEKVHALFTPPVHKPTAVIKKPLVPADRYYDNVNYRQV